MRYLNGCPETRFEVMKLLVWLGTRERTFCECPKCRYMKIIEFRELGESDRAHKVRALCAMTAQEWRIAAQVCGDSASCLLWMLRPAEFEAWISRWVAHYRWSATDLRIMARVAHMTGSHPPGIRRADGARDLSDAEMAIRENFLLHPRLHPVFIGELLRVFPDRKSRLGFFPQILPVAHEYPELRGALREWNVREERERFEQAEAARESGVRTDGNRAPGDVPRPGYGAEVARELRGMGFWRAMELVLTERPELQAWFPEEWQALRDEFPDAPDSAALKRILESTGGAPWLAELREFLTAQVWVQERRRRRNAERDKKLEELRGLPFKERMASIAGASRPLTYYPRAWALELLDAGIVLPLETARGLYARGSRLSRTRDREWRSVVRHLRRKYALDALA